MTSHVEFHRLAIAEARAERRYYARISLGLSARFMADLDGAILRISANPQMGPPHLYGTRIGRFQRFPFYLVYREEPTGLLVLAVANLHRKPGYWRRRVP
jgi:toxin ParE2